MTTTTKTVRIDEQRAEILAAIAEANGTSQNQVLLDGIDAIAERFRHDSDFKARMERVIERQKRVLELLQ